MYKTTINMTIIEFLKYSTGWFALTSNISKFPFWLIFTFALSYTVSYMIYKFKFKGREIKQRKPFFSFSLVICLGAYITSIIIYGFPLSLIFLLTLKAINWLRYGRIGSMIFMLLLFLKPEKA